MLDLSRFHQEKDSLNWPPELSNSLPATPRAMFSRQTQLANALPDCLIEPRAWPAQAPPQAFGESIRVEIPKCPTEKDSPTYCAGRGASLSSLSQALWSFSKLAWGRKPSVSTAVLEQRRPGGEQLTAAATARGAHTPLAVT